MRWLDRTRLLAGWALVLTSLVIAPVAVNARVVRQYGEPGDWGATTATDGLRNWQGWVLLAWVVLGAIVMSERRRWWLLLVPIAGFFWAAINTDAHLDRLLAKQAGPRTYHAEIPIRPPSGPILREDGFPLHFQSGVRVYDLRIPTGIELVAVGCLLLAALSALLLVGGVAEELIRRRSRRSAAATSAVA